jgi:hypothetical protein
MSIVKGTKPVPAPLLHDNALSRDRSSTTFRGLDYRGHDLFRDRRCRSSGVLACGWWLKQDGNDAGVAAVDPDVMPHGNFPGSRSTYTFTNHTSDRELTRYGILFDEVLCFDTSLMASLLNFAHYHELQHCYTSNMNTKDIGSCEVVVPVPSLSHVAEASIRYDTRLYPHPAT